MGLREFPARAAPWVFGAAVVIGAARALDDNGGFWDVISSVLLHLFLAYVIGTILYIFASIVWAIAGKRLSDPTTSIFRKILILLLGILVSSAVIDVFFNGGHWLVRPFFFLLGGNWEDSYWACTNWVTIEDDLGEHSKSYCDDP